MSGTGHQVTGCILAGGRGTRFGGLDKGLIELAGRPLAAHVVERLQPQVNELVISVNRNIDAYRAIGGRIVVDVHDDYAGPLAGMAATLEAAVTPLVVFVPCDSPYFPGDLVHRLHTAMSAQAATIATVRTGTRRQPVFALVTRELLADLQVFLRDGGRKVEAWYARHACADVEFGADCAAFLNINTAAELTAAAGQATAS